MNSKMPHQITVQGDPDMALTWGPHKLKQIDEYTVFGQGGREMQRVVGA